MWNDKGRSGYGDTNLDGTYDDAILGVSPNGRQYRNETTLEQRDLSGWAYWNLRKQTTPEQEIPEALYARNETEAMSHTLANGRANLAKYADPIVVHKSTKVPLKNRILPQASRVDKLRSEAIELELAFKAGEFTPEEYTLLRSVAFRKLHRAEELLKKAITPVQKAGETDEDSAQVQAFFHTSSGFGPSPNDEHASEEYEEIGVVWIDQLSSENSLKGVLKFSCKAIRGLVRLSSATKRYIKTLQEV